MTQPLKLLQPRFVTRAEALTLHRASLDVYGGSDGILDDGMLESALAQPRQQFNGEYAHAFPFGMAAAYGYHLAMNHPLRDGNKRTAFAAMVVFLRMNGWDFAMPDDRASRMMLEMIEQRRDKAWLAGQLAEQSRCRCSMELRDFFSVLTLAELQAAEPLLATNPRPAELFASLDDATAAIPVIGELAVSLADHLNDRERMFPVILGRLLLLRALHRVAEDLGYEW